MTSSGAARDARSEFTDLSTSAPTGETVALAALLRPALIVFVFLTAVTGLAYPAIVTFLAQAAFPEEAAGSLIVRDGKVVGSALVGQAFAEPRYFWTRPSATTPNPYNASASAGSNQGPLHPALAESVKGRIDALRAADPGKTGPVPVDLVTASASGLDPHVSVAAARFQIDRVAAARDLAPAAVARLVDDHAEGRWLSWFGEPRVNVLRLNLALDTLRR